MVKLIIQYIISFEFDYTCSSLNSLECRWRALAAAAAAESAAAAAAAECSPPDAEEEEPVPYASEPSGLEKGNYGNLYSFSLAMYDL